MPKTLRTGSTVPYRDIADIQKAMQYLEDNCDGTYLLIFKVALITGLRISDVLSLRYDKNLQDGFIVLIESKHQKQAQARARLKVLVRAKETLAHICDDKEQLIKIMFTKPKDIYPLLPSGLQSQIDSEIEREIGLLKYKKRYCKIPEHFVAELRARQKKHKKHDAGFIFATSTLKTNRGNRTGKTIGRKTAWAVFKKIGEQLDFDFNTACHQLRKTFAVLLFNSTGNNGALVVKTVGWQDDKLLQTYLAIDENESHNAVEMMQKGLI